MDNKALFALIEEYGTKMRELGSRDADSLSLKRNRAFIASCKLIAKIERELEV